MNEIEIVRAHRLGTFVKDQNRPIIVKFQLYSDKQQILQHVFKGKLNDVPGKFVTEDFSVNTTKDRKFLRDQLLVARAALGKQLKSSSVRYKTIHVTNNYGKRSFFTLNKVSGNVNNWWRTIPGPDAARYTHSDIDNVTDEGNSLTQIPDGGSSSNEVEEPAVLEPTEVPAPESEDPARVRRASG